MLYISYLRVSTQAQGASGLGLEAQRTIVMGYLHNNNGKLIAEFVEIESGKRNDRPKLLEAIQKAKNNNATLLVAKLDRLARNLHFISTLMENKTQFVACDLPSANTLTLGIMASLSQYERELISTRTKNALTAKKQKEPDWIPGTNNLTPAGTIKALETIRFKARNDIHVKHAFHFIEPLKEKGLTFQQIADKLSAEGYKTRNGNHNWHGMQVYYIWKRFSESSGKAKRVQ